MSHASPNRVSKTSRHALDRHRVADRSASLVGALKPDACQPADDDNGRRDEKNTPRCSLDEAIGPTNPRDNDHADQHEKRRELQRSGDAERHTDRPTRPGFGQELRCIGQNCAITDAESERAADGMRVGGDDTPRDDVATGPELR